MIIGELLLNIVSEGLKFLNEREAREIEDKILRLREGMRSELAKGSMRDDALLDMYDVELRELGSLFLARIKKASPQS